MWLATFVYHVVVVTILRIFLRRGGSLRRLFLFVEDIEQYFRDAVIRVRKIDDDEI